MKRLEKGFTLIELMIVVAIIAILAAVAAPKFGKQIKKSRDAKAISLVGTWRSASQLYYADEEGYASGFGDLLDKVDNTTVNSSYEDNAGTIITTGTSLNIVGGTSSLVFTDTAANGVKDKPRILSTYDTDDGSITISDTNGDDSRDVPWESL